jgi:hypothetical protein
MKTFLMEDFFHLELRILQEFSKKCETALIEYSGAWGKLIHENRKSRGTVPLSILKSFFLHFFTRGALLLYTVKYI